MCLQVFSKSRASCSLWLWKSSWTTLFRPVFQLACYTTRVNVVHSVCVPVRKTPGDIFHTLHIKVQIFDLEYRRPQQSCWKRHSPIYKQGLSETCCRRSEAERESVCGWVDGPVGVGSLSPASRAQQRAEEEEGECSHFTQVTAVVLRDKSTQGESFFFFFQASPPLLFISTLCGHAVRGDRPLWVTAALRMPMSHSL